MIQFDSYFSNGLKPPTSYHYTKLEVKIKHTRTEAMELEREATLKANVERVEVCGLVGGFLALKNPGEKCDEHL